MRTPRRCANQSSSARNAVSASPRARWTSVAPLGHRDAGHQQHLQQEQVGRPQPVIRPAAVSAPVLSPVSCRTPPSRTHSAVTTSRVRPAATPARSGHHRGMARGSRTETRGGVAVVVKVLVQLGHGDRRPPRQQLRQRRSGRLRVFGRHVELDAVARRHHHRLAHAGQRGQLGQRAVDGVRFDGEPLAHRDRCRLVRHADEQEIDG